MLKLQGHDVTEGIDTDTLSSTRGRGATNWLEEAHLNPLAPTARTLFQGALAIFVVTIVIGILNGMDIWEPPRELLLTHVHAGTLGWITLAVVGAAMLMFGEGADAAAVDRGRLIGTVTIAVTALYVIAFATGTGIFRPIAGTLMLAAIIWVLVWVSGRYPKVASNTPRLAMMLAVVSLTIGAVLGVLLGLFIARGSIPGLSSETAASLAGAHPPAMLIGYLILAGVAITDWLLAGPETRLGPIVAWALFGAGLVVNAAFILDQEALIQAATLLEVIAIILFLVRMWPRIQPSAWRQPSNDNFARMSVLFLAVGIALLVYVVQLFVSGELNPETGEGPVGVLLAFDHAMFIGVMTNALFAAVARTTNGSYSRPVMWAVNGGLTLFLFGLVVDVAIFKQIGAPLMGLALLWAVYFYLRQLMTGRSVPV